MISHPCKTGTVFQHLLVFFKHDWMQDIAEDIT